MPCPVDLATELSDLTPDLMRLARHLTRQHDPAQDLCQETLLRLWRRRGDIGEIDNLRAYARATLRNLYRQSLRNSVLLTQLDETHLIIGPRVFATLALSDLYTAIARLPPDQARLIRLVASGETSPQALAQRMGLAVGTVMSRLARARAQLRIDMDLRTGASVAALI